MNFKRVAYLDLEEGESVEIRSSQQTIVIHCSDEDDNPGYLTIEQDGFTYLAGTGRCGSHASGDDNCKLVEIHSTEILVCDAR